MVANQHQMELRLGAWQDALADVDMVDAVICDPPYGNRTHKGDAAAAVQQMSATGQPVRNSMDYAHLTPGQVFEFVSSWAPRCRGWFVAFTSHDLIPEWERSFKLFDRYSFAPVLHLRKLPRLLGDGPASWTDYIMVARPRTREFSTWGCLPGWYMQPTSEARKDVPGGKSLSIMEAIIQDYSRPGDLICDPCAGGGTTLLAAAIHGRRAIGAEMDPETHAKAQARLDKGYTPSMFSGQSEGTATQTGLFPGD